MRFTCCTIHLVLSITDFIWASCCCNFSLEYLRFLSFSGLCFSFSEYWCRGVLHRLAVYATLFFISSLAWRHRLLVFVAGFVSCRSIDNCGRLLRRVWQLFCCVNRARSWVVVCPLQLVGRWVPLDFLLLYTCPLQLLDYFGGVRRGSGRRGSAARRLPEAGLALLSPPSSPAEPRCQLGATLPDHLSLTLQLSSSPHPHLYYTRIPVKLLFYRPAYVSIPSLYRGLAECRHRTGSHLRCPNYPTQICGPDHLHSTVPYSVPVAQFRCRCTVHGKDIGIVFLVLYCPAV